jgi:K+-transporting ATPase KdpF subunit
MSIIYILGAACAMALFLYLIYALVRAEDF